MNASRILVVDDEAPMRSALEAHFARDGWDVVTAYGANDALAKFRRSPCPLVVTDMRMPDGDGMGVMRNLRQLSPRVGIIFLTAFASVPDAVRAIHEGASDYLVKPVCFEQLREVAERVLARVSTRVHGVREQSIIGESEKLKVLLERARHVARSEMDVLVEAESGTGKELLARLIHQTSERRNRPFVAVNCAAFPEALLESELFGHARGAFTGAVAAKPGKFELAHSGTLLLDEVGELPLTLQPKLLRVLQEREVDRLGDTRPVGVDVRVVATTNQALPKLVESGKFRADLYYRLNVVPMTIPPLRERGEDVLLLAQHFLEKFSREFNKPGLELSDSAKEHLQSYRWPGNVRELQNTLERAVILADGVSISAGELQLPATRPDPAALPSGMLPDNFSWDGSLEDISNRAVAHVERVVLEGALRDSKWNKTRAAERLGVSPKTLLAKLRAVGLEQ